jgi:mannose-6-phosphate isomerase-like protein (cupin superfamily)
MKSGVRIIDPTSEYFIDEGCHITELSNSRDDPELSIARARVEPGMATRWHYLVDTAERYVLLEGHGLVEVEGMAAQRVGPGDVVLIPPGARQRITNEGETDLLFLALCTPRFNAAAYVDAENGTGG